ncbi:hypothetical protein BKA62DRAFT_701211 [Auriculariales sp. MPI-PUGE-AT-0066]|nr:hypothetical protein BKA62DRAFT_701211 [Auriculariales sp. MPI-PUGE-AT-0066]
MSNVTASRYDSPPLMFNPELQLGPWLIGFCLEALLTGVVLALASCYARSYATNDGFGIRGIVAVLVFLCTLKTIQVGAEVWHVTIFGWGSFTRATSTSWYAALDAFHSSVIVSISQSFYVIRLRIILQRHRFHWVLVIVILAMLTSLASNFATSILLFHTDPRKQSRMFQKFQTAQTVGLLVADILICSTFCWLLLRAKTGMSQTDSLVDRIVAIGWTTTLVPLLNEIVRVALHDTIAPKNISFLVFAFMQSKLYAVSVMITLCLRQQLLAEGSTTSQEYKVTGWRVGRPDATSFNAPPDASHLGNNAHLLDPRRQNNTTTSHGDDSEATFEMETRKRGELHKS